MHQRAGGAVQRSLAGLAQLVTLGETLHSWSEEIGRMWRFTRNNGILTGVRQAWHRPNWTPDRADLHEFLKTMQQVGN